MLDACARARVHARPAPPPQEPRAHGAHRAAAHALSARTVRLRAQGSPHRLQVRATQYAGSFCAVPFSISSFALRRVEQIEILAHRNCPRTSSHSLVPSRAPPASVPPDMRCINLPAHQRHTDKGLNAKGQQSSKRQIFEQCSMSVAYMMA
eukprot:6209158-Pleurochrysis_carterae.AAC.5